MIVPKASGITKPLNLLLGVVMSLAILDHTRLFFHFWNTDPYGPETTPFLFFTRFISHYFVPAIYLVTGITVYLAGRERPKPGLSRYLLLLGTGFLVLELMPDNFSWTFDIYYRTVGVFIFGGIGLCLLLFSVLIYLPVRWLVAIGVVIIALHHVLDDVRMEGTGAISVVWYIFHQHKIFLVGERVFVINYTLFPWLGVMLLGYGMGPLYSGEYDGSTRRKWLFRLGIAAIVLFFLWRGAQIYGDPDPWAVQEDPVRTVMSFLNLTKYPASLDFLLITLGPVWLFLLASDKVKNGRLASFFTVFGNTPVFCYLSSTYLIHAAAALVLRLQGNNWKDMIIIPASYGNGSPLKDYGYKLGIVYFIWMGFMLILYFLLKYFQMLKGKLLRR
ncbi:DUF1624 domain-containing protein [Sinomicrobium weinanense]|uniref:DUF1624 domain-containing protein n=1 Tax=Sinomicrobium weinanense TaxID=2842200 RepID=A0A926JNL6_9FLAO|nr:heparan-alpha-glucosaminide N-acetyltransferase domain-containing protein [Sinomicrobium weinanense]MBC9794521.1 DUF1624 domain-containing protein [Sinomicrobium weinanense]MBU3124428.1 DUF1624 domain-containing protein [Sinomicrobium weinanense]